MKRKCVNGAIFLHLGCFLVLKGTHLMLFGAFRLSIIYVSCAIANILQKPLRHVLCVVLPNTPRVMA